MAEDTQGVIARRRAVADAPDDGELGEQMGDRPDLLKQLLHRPDPGTNVPSCTPRISL